MPYTISRITKRKSFKEVFILVFANFVWFQWQNLVPAALALQNVTALQITLSSNLILGFPHQQTSCTFVNVENQKIGVHCFLPGGLKC